jgi:hypothetical protein
MIFSDEELLGTFVFGLIKLVGYYYVVRNVARGCPARPLASPLVVALARIALGAVIAFPVVSTMGIHKSWPMYGALVLVRFIEWAFIFVLFYERSFTAIDWKRIGRHATFGTVVSCLLDLPAVMGAVIIPVLAYGIC